MKKVVLNKTNTNMKSGKFEYILTVFNEQGESIDKGFLSITVDQWMQTYNELNGADDIHVDEAIIRKAFKEEVIVVIDGKELKPIEKTAKQKIEEELASKDYTLDELENLLKTEEINFKNLKGLASVAAKTKIILINKMIDAKFNDMFEQYSKNHTKITTRWKERKHMNKIKVQFPISKVVNGIEYRGAKTSLRTVELADMGITEENPYINIEYDKFNKRIIITPAE